MGFPCGYIIGVVPTHVFRNCHHQKLEISLSAIFCESIEVIHSSIERIYVEPILGYQSGPLEVIVKPGDLMEQQSGYAHINEVIEMLTDAFKVSESIAVRVPRPRDSEAQQSWVS